MIRRSRVLAPLLAAVLLFGAPAAPAASGPVDIARREFDRGNYQQAAAVLDPLAENSQDARLHFWLGRSYFELHNFGRAVAAAERSVLHDPENSDYHLWLGRSYGRKAEQSGWFSGFSLARKARRQFEEAVRLQPSNFSAQHDLIQFYLEAPGIVGGGQDKALKQIETLAALDAAEGHLGRGAYGVKLKKLEQAEGEYRKVLAGKPRRINIYFDVADFFEARKDPAQMEEAVEGAARIDASDPRLDYYRGVSLVLAGKRPAKAEEFLKNYLAVVPPRSDRPAHAAAREWLGKLYEGQGRCRAAADEYRKALDLDTHLKTAREALKRVEKCPPGP